MSQFEDFKSNLKKLLDEREAFDKIKDAEEKAAKAAKKAKK